MSSIPSMEEEVPVEGGGSLEDHWKEKHTCAEGKVTCHLSEIKPKFLAGKNCGIKPTMSLCSNMKPALFKGNEKDL